ncbi:MAG: type II toxin-antitoxin system VapC family toxin [bacterium]
MIIIDSDILIWILRGNKEIRAQFEKAITQTGGSIFITPIQLAELYAGIREKEKLDTEKFLTTFSLINIDGKIGRLAGEFMNKYHKSHSITIADALIAASTKICGLKLWTLNKKHYPMLEKVDFFLL